MSGLIPWIVSIMFLMLVMQKHINVCICEDRWVLITDRARSLVIMNHQDRLNNKTCKVNVTFCCVFLQELSVWVYPSTAGLIEDSVVCCIKENPEPTIFHISCRGVWPELEVQHKQINFEKIFLGRWGAWYSTYYVMWVPTR